MSGSARRRRPTGGGVAGSAGRLLLAAVLVAVLAGCQVTTAVAVRVGAGGAGSVTVTVTLDAAAAAAVGDLAAQLRTADLTAAGWRVSGPRRGPGGSVTVTAVHAFATERELPAILAEVAGAPRSQGGPGPLFTLRLVTRRTFWTTTTAVTGAVDLRCGVACFGDAGLQHAYGHADGVDPSTLEGPAGTAAAKRALRFTFSLRLPGRDRSSDAAVRDGVTYRWTPELGGRTALAVTTSAEDETHVHEAVAAAVAAAVLLAVVVATLVVVVRRHRRGRRPGPLHARRG